MGARRASVAVLAAEAGIDIDEALVRLWDAGIDGVEDARDLIAGRELTDARIALGIPSAKELTTPAWWQSRLSLDDPAFEGLLDQLGIKMSREARRLPKGAVGRLSRYARGRVVNDPRPRAVAAERVEAPWETLGTPRRVRLLSGEEVNSIHSKLVADFATDPDPMGVRGGHVSESLGLCGTPRNHNDR